MTLSDGEHFFISGSKDKTVKIWSLRNQGRSSSAVSCQLTYNGHQKAVVAVELLERTDTVASCDGTLQVCVIVLLLDSTNQFQPISLDQSACSADYSLTVTRR